MRSTTRRAIVGTAAGFSLVLASPFVSAANAHGHNGPTPGHHGNGGPETGRHGWHSSSNPAESPARQALHTAIKAANQQLRLSVRAARSAFRADPAVIAAAAAREAIVSTATDPSLILAANTAYVAATSAAAATRDAAPLGPRKTIGQRIWPPDM